MGVELENRMYGPDSSPEEIEAIRERIRWVSDDTILYQEVPSVNEFSINTQWQRIVELSAERDEFYMLIDLLPVVKSPGAEGRSRIKAGFDEVKGKVVHAAVATGKNAIMNAMARFVMARLGLQAFSVHKTLDEANEALANARQRRNS